MTHVVNNSGKEEWYTPPLIADLVRHFWYDLGGIHLDPASSAKANEIIKARYYIDKEENALRSDKKHWIDKGEDIRTVFVNPPYSRGKVDKFASRLINTVRWGEGIQAIWLSNNFTETQTGQLLLENCKAACFVEKRIKFLNEDLEEEHAPLQGQMILGFGDDLDVEWFCLLFNYLGTTFVTYELEEI